jgi:hypothetical protein
MLNNTTQDLFNPQNLRLKQDFAETLGVAKLMTECPVHKPGGQDFVRVHPAEDMRMIAAVLHLKDDNDFCLVTPEVAALIPQEVKPMCLFTAVDREGNVFLWPAKLPSDTDRKTMRWYRSGLDAAETAMKNWVRIQANMKLGAYEIVVAKADLGEPKWPENLNFSELLRVAFRDNLISSLDHAILKKLRGEE